MKIQRRSASGLGVARRRPAAAVSRPAPVLAAGAAAVALLLSTGTASANGFLESQGWQFRSPNETIARLSTEDLRQRKKGGFFDSFQVTNNNTSITNIHGDQVNCDLEASTIGNLGSNGISNSAASPTISPDGTVGAETLGNRSDSGLSGRFPHLASLGSGTGSATGYPAQELNSDQSNVGSNLSSDAFDNAIDIQTGEVNSTGTTANPVLNSDQQVTGSNQNTSVTGSSACHFIPQSGTAVTTSGE